MPCSAKDAKERKFPLSRHGWVDSAERGLVALLGFLGSVVSRVYKPQINNACIKFPDITLAQNRRNNYQLQLQVTVNSAVSSTVQQHRRTWLWDYVYFCWRGSG